MLSDVHSVLLIDKNWKFVDLVEIFECGISQGRLVTRLLRPEQKTKKPLGAGCPKPSKKRDVERDDTMGDVMELNNA